MVFFISLVNKEYLSPNCIVITSDKDILIADSYQLNEQFRFLVVHTLCDKHPRTSVKNLASVTIIYFTLKIKLWFDAFKGKNAYDIRKTAKFLENIL